MENYDDDTWGFFVEIDKVPIQKSVIQEPKKIQYKSNEIIHNTPILYLFCIFDWFYKKGNTKKI
tara:strand:+ start:1302 stop:1493 length:192 start_codon:yes stop_codon:yes gene_type:complete